MPGHSEEVLAVYPQLSCSGIPYKNSEFCIGNEETFSFIEDVLTETMAIFPSVYIHVGGDEASTKAWKECPKCQQRKKDLGLSTGHELQSYLIKRVEKFLTAHHRKLLGWDEILEGGLAPGATVMSWRGEKGGIEAAEQNHDVIMTPGECYLDAYQSDPNTQPEAIGGYLPLQRVYNYEPVPALLNPAKAGYIKGMQANVWTEYMPTTYQVEYMVYPRAMALAETAWSAKEKKNFANFQERLQWHYLLLQRNGVNYYRPSTLLTVNTQPDTSKQQDLVGFNSEQYQPEIHYTTDGSSPLLASPLYQQPFYTSGKTVVTAAIFKNGVATGNASAFTVNYHKAIGKKIIFNTLWSDSYPAQREATLSNGIEGSLTYGDKQWLGYLKDFDITVDMDAVQTINSLSIRFMQQPGPGVFLPAQVEILFSDDGINFTAADKQINTISPKAPETIFKSFSFAFSNRAARYIRIKAPNTQGGFMFTDEVIIY
jgi:hexosaminidase